MGPPQPPFIIIELDFLSLSYANIGTEGEASPPHPPRIL